MPCHFATDSIVRWSFFRRFLQPGCTCSTQNATSQISEPDGFEKHFHNVLYRYKK